MYGHLTIAPVGHLLRGQPVTRPACPACHLRQPGRGGLTSEEHRRKIRGVIGSSGRTTIKSPCHRTGSRSHFS